MADRKSQLLFFSAPLCRKIFQVLSLVFFVPSHFILNQLQFAFIPTVPLKLLHLQFGLALSPHYIWSLRSNWCSWSFPPSTRTCFIWFSGFAVLRISPCPTSCPISIIYFLMNPPHILKCPKTQVWVFWVHTYFLHGLFQSHGFKCHKCINQSQIRIFSSDFLPALRLMDLTPTSVFLSLYLVPLGWPCPEWGTSVLIIWDESISSWFFSHVDTWSLKNNFV